jgi:Ca2+-binding RTX toxin-like protein
MTNYQGTAANDQYASTSLEINSLLSNGGNDKLIGGFGDDSLVGRSGNDVLLGGSHNDNLSGGKGSDRSVVMQRLA